MGEFGKNSVHYDINVSRYFSSYRISILSGFYSKDAIIEFAYLKDTSVGYYVSAVGIFTAFLTAIYSWRLFLKLFLDHITTNQSQ